MSATGTHDVAPRMVLVAPNGPFHAVSHGRSRRELSLDPPHPDRHAGLPASGLLHSFTEEQIDRALRVNLRAPMQPARPAR